ncbi:RNA polymerase sigma factor, sigma-70 family [Cnuella takakiae]|uniref:RNA polymerase sigma factor, sigma-70 family n=1 Tax=Cnuella takakiae TaxID=1302690 RepID=A0A1M4VHP7_9BACT|nr:sigma-70 family RNA polymerase sigma factor [Cnuella takakiae]OLY92595.1 RNA polymerase subunit sigma-70 [Cnuella takakiae]SHE68375.1 RNA polymerase sigma factor, sigma-70 family [Cnuella takakiae]
MKADNETLLLRGLAKNDRKAIETIYRENYNLVQALVVKNNGTAEDAKDIFQEAMIVLFEKAKQESFTLQCQLRTYIYSICRRLWLKRLLQQNRFMIAEDSEVELAHVEEEVEEQERLNTEFSMMEKAINSLGEPCKSLLEAFYLQKRNMQDIALSFGYTNAENAKNQKYKCLVRLKKLFFSQYNSQT